MTRSRVRSVVLMLLLAVGLLALFAQPAAASPGAYRVLFLNAVSDGCLGDTGVQSGLAGMPHVAAVDGFDASAGTPSVAQLESYDMVVAHSDCGGWNDSAAAGDNVADYANHGGVVVEFAYSMEDFLGDQLAGRWQSEGHSPYIPGNNDNNDVTLGAFDASSPLMAGVNTLTSPGCNVAPTLAPGATRVAQWNNGQEAVALKGKVVGVTASIDDFGCSGTGDYARLTYNALTTFTPPFGTEISKAKINRKKHTAKFLFGAAGTVTGFECSLTRPKKKKKGKKSAASFAACSSPKLYKKLKPGKYTFQVRGTNSAGPDPAPATRKFKI
jgi:hypothetical protein